MYRGSLIKQRHRAASFARQSGYATSRHRRSRLSCSRHSSPRRSLRSSSLQRRASRRSQLRSRCSESVDTTMGLKNFSELGFASKLHVAGSSIPMMNDPSAACGDLKDARASGCDGNHVCMSAEERIQELEKSHDQLRGALTAAGMHIRKFRNDPKNERMLLLLRRTLTEARTVRRSKLPCSHAR